jgi:hypothetical protein
MKTFGVVAFMALVGNIAGIKNPYPDDKFGNEC